MGWAEPHQFGDHGTEFLVYGPRTGHQLDAVLSIVQESLAFAHDAFEDGAASSG